MKKKKLLSLFLAVVMVMSLFGQGAASAAITSGSASIHGMDGLSIPAYSGKAADFSDWLDAFVAGVSVTSTELTEAAVARGVSLEGNTGDYSEYEGSGIRPNSYTDGAMTVDGASYATLIACAIPADEEPQFIEVSDEYRTFTTLSNGNVGSVGGHGSYKLVFLLYEYTESGYSLELIDYWTSSAIFQVDAYNVTFEYESQYEYGIYFYATLGDTDFDLLDFVSAYDENGDPVQTYISYDSNFDINVAGDYDVQYGAVHPISYETVTLYTTVRVEAKAVNFNTYSTIGNSPYVYATKNVLGSNSEFFEADENLPERLKQYFYLEDGTKIPTDAVLLSDDGGYDPDVTENTNFVLTYNVLRPDDNTIESVSININMFPCYWYCNFEYQPYSGAWFNTNGSFSSEYTDEENTKSYTVTTGDTSFWLYIWQQLMAGEAESAALFGQNEYRAAYLIAGNRSDADSYKALYNQGVYQAGYCPYSNGSEFYTDDDERIIDKYVFPEIDYGGLDINTPGEYTVTVKLHNGSANGEVVLTGWFIVTVQGTASVNSLTYSGTEDEYLVMGTVTNPLDGVTAADENGNAYTVTISDDGGFDYNAVGDYTVSYSVSAFGQTFAATKVFHVADSMPVSDSSVQLSLDAANAFGTNTDDFVLGTYGQQNIIMRLEYRGDIRNEGRKVTVKIPYGFELLQPLPTATVAQLNAVVTGGYNNPNGTTFSYSIADGAESQISMQFQVSVHLECLYPSLSSDSTQNTYSFSADSLSNGLTLADTTLTLDSNRTAKLPDVAVDISENALIWSPEEIWGDADDDYNNGVRRVGSRLPYKITVTKEPGTLAAPDWNLTYTLPDGLLSTYYSGTYLYNYKMTYYDDADAVIGTLYGDSATLSFSGQDVKVNLFNSSRYTFNNVGSSNTYMDANEKTAKVEILFYFNLVPSNEQEEVIKKNWTEDLSGANDEGDMTGSAVTIHQTSRDGTSADVTESSADIIKLRLVTQANQMSIRTSLATSTTLEPKTTVNNSSYLSWAGGSNKSGVYKDLSVTTDWPYEFSPVSAISYNSTNYTITYTVSDVNGVVGDKTDLSYSGIFDLDAGEYVSSTTVTSIAADSIYVPHYSHSSTYCPTFKCITKSEDINGTELDVENGTTVEINYSARGTALDEQTTTRSIIIKVVQVEEVEKYYNLDIYATDKTANVGVIGPTTSWSTNQGIQIYLGANKYTETYEDAALYIVGDAVAMSNPSSLYANGRYFSYEEIKVIAYSIDPNATSDGGGEWITDPYMIEVARLTNFKNVGVLTGIKVLTTSGVSSKLSVTKDKLLTTFDTTASYSASALYQGQNISVTLNNTFDFLSENARLGIDDLATYNKLQPVVYYVLPAHVSFISAASTAWNGDVDFDAYPQSDGTTVLKVTYNNLILTKGAGIRVNLNVNPDMAPASQRLIAKAYFDIPYEELYSWTERGYGISVDPSAYFKATLPDWTGITEGDANKLCLARNITAAVNVLEKREIGIATYPTATQEDGKFSAGNYMTAVTGTSADTFGGKTYVMGDIQYDTTDWNIYIPIAKLGDIVEYLDIGAGQRVNSAATEFDMELSGPLGMGTLPPNTEVTYTTSAAPQMNTLYGNPDGADYKTAAEITDWSAVTAIHIHIPLMEQGIIYNYLLDYQNVDKTDIGTQYAYNSMYYNYTVNGSLYYTGEFSSPNFGVSTLDKYELTDMYISGSGWLDKSHNSLKDSHDSAYEGASMQVSLVDASGAVIKTYDQTAEVEATNANLNAVTDGNGSYTLAVPGYGTYIVGLSAIPDETLLVRKQASGGTANNQSVFYEDSAVTEILTLDSSAVNHHIYNQNFGLYAIELDVQNISYGVDESEISEAEAKALAFAEVLDVDGNPIDLSNITVDLDELAALNASIAANELDFFPLTFSHTYDDNGTPNDTSDDKIVEETIRVWLKDTGIGEEGSTDRITADDATYGIANGAIDAVTLKKIVHTDAIDANGSSYFISQIAVNESDLAALNQAIANGKPCEQVPIRLTSPDGHEVTIVVKLHDEGTIAVSTDYITANNIYLESDTGTLSEDDSRTLSDVYARNKYGFPYDTDELAVDQTELGIINRDIESGAAQGNSYPLTFTTPAGTAVTITVTIGSSPDSGGNNPIYFYTLHFQTNGGDSIDSVTKFAGATVDLSNYIATRDGFTFNGWYSDIDLSNKVASVTLYSDRTVYAAWKNSGELENPDYGSDLNMEDHFAYVKGYPDGTVQPNGNITRAETATMVYRLLTESKRASVFTSANSFSDVASELWYNKAVSSMANGGYICGYTDGSFKGNNAITRAEFVAILVRFIGADNSTASFTDVPTSHWAYQYIATATDAGWISGYNDGSFGPDNYITRAEAMTIINRVLYRGINENSALPSGIKVWPDNQNGAWYYYEVIEATNDHAYTGIRPVEDWTSLSIDYTYDIAKYEHPQTN